MSSYTKLVDTLGKYEVTQPILQGLENNRPSTTEEIEKFAAVLLSVTTKASRPRWFHGNILQYL